MGEDHGWEAVGGGGGHEGFGGGAVEGDVEEHSGDVSEDISGIHRKKNEDIILD